MTITCAGQKNGSHDEHTKRRVIYEHDYFFVNRYTSGTSISRDAHLALNSAIILGP